jgi:asparagine synthase (glutamine-hydrolysing)
MCGIAGFIDTECSHGRAELLIDRMCQAIRHRGPDDQGVWIGDGIALGMRRLSIIDLAGGHQPIFNEDHSILVVFNGEIYNYQELKTRLQERGHRFRTNSDTETIVHAYEEYGDECVNHLRGMFSFALWDGKGQRLLAARDRFGKKPLNYFWDGQRLIFGSEIKSILEADIQREVNPIALDEYLVYCYVPAPNTLFKNIFKLPAAHILIYENGQIRTKRYWELSFAPTCQHDEATAIERTRELLKEAVKVRLMSEVPLGAFLSGGIDSSLVVCFMSSMTSEPVKTFSIGFDEHDYSELKYARQVANYFGTEHHEFFVRPDLVSVLPELVWAYDEPFADVSMLPTYYVSKLAREHVTVVLTGDGGDEIFGGYTRYARELAITRTPLLLRLLLGNGSMLMPDGMRGKKRLQNLHSNLANRYARTLASLPDNLRSCLYTREHLAVVGHHIPYDQLTRKFKRVSHLDVMSQMQYADVETYLTDDILVKVDKASMLNSLETRAPLLDQHLVEYVASLPSAIRTHGGTLKSLLKKVAPDMLPEAVVTRPKQGFGVPIQRWLRADLANYARELLDSPRAHQRGIFNQEFIRHLLKSHSRSSLINHGEAIWTLLCLELWFRTYMDLSSFEQNVEMHVMSNF